jgi:hypothetical protein
MSTAEISLPYPTNRTVEGPRLQQDRAQLVLKYDCQRDDGSIDWSKVVFAEVLAVQYRQVSCCAAASVIGAREVRCLTQSSWLTEVLGLWNESVGWQDWQKKQGGSARFKHFTVFFDDAGCVDVIAASCLVA